jgi:hypothetical protein
MERKKVIEKIRKFLEKNSKFMEECEAVYLMVEVRKILDRDKNNLFEVLRFYCNWTLHVNLKNKKTTQFISKTFDQYIDPKKSGKDIARKMKSNHADFFKLNDFKNELRKFFKDYDFPLNLTDENRNWVAFIKLFLEIIRECPVICIESSEKINKLELVKDKNGQYCYKFNLMHGGRPPVIKLKFK